MAIQDDFTVAQNGDIRYVGAAHGASGAGYYTVIEFHRWLQQLADNASAVVTAGSSDYLDITDSTPSERQTDNIIQLINSYNIDDFTAEHLYNGSVIQAGGDVYYDGLVIIASKGMDLQLVQNNAVIGNDFWNTIPNGDTYKGINRDEANGISHRFMIKVRTGGADIDGRRLLGRTLVWGQSYSEFKINGTSRGNNVMALTYASDLNNQTTIGTVAGWGTITNTSVGYNGIDVNNDTTNEYYYSKWDVDKPTRSINDFYQRMKWLSGQQRVEASCTDTGSDFPIGNGTITRQAQSFDIGTLDTHLVKVHVNLKKTGSPTGNLVAKLYSHTGTYGSTGVPNSAVVTSVNIDVSKLTTSYQTIKIGFTSHYLMLAATNYYFISLEYTGDASNYVNVQGLATSGTHGGNRASYSGSWTAAANDDLNFEVYASPSLYGLPGCVFRGITHEVALTGQGVTDWSPYETVTWSGGSGQMLAVDDVNASTKMWIQLLTGVAPTNTQVITGSTSTATANCSGTPTERILSFPFCGQSTGSTLIGSYGFGIEAADLTANDKVFDLTNTQRTPPNYVTLTVQGLVSGEDYILVGPSNAGNLHYNQFSLNTTLSTDNITSVVISTTIPEDTPSSGYIRVADNNGVYRKLHYSAWATSTFTIDTTDGNEDFASVNATSGNNVFISYVDVLASSTSAAFTCVKNTGTRDLYIRVRDGGEVNSTPIKTYESTYQLTTSPTQSTSVIRTSDL